MCVCTLLQSITTAVTDDDDHLELQLLRRWQQQQQQQKHSPTKILAVVYIGLWSSKWVSSEEREEWRIEQTVPIKVPIADLIGLPRKVRAREAVFVVCKGCTEELDRRRKNCGEHPRTFSAHSGLLFPFRQNCCCCRPFWNPPLNVGHHPAIGYY